MIDVYHEATDTIVALRARVALLEDLVKSAPVPHPAPHECAWDCRDTCSARDAWRERRRLLLMARLDDAITHLATQSWGQAFVAGSLEKLWQLGVDQDEKPRLAEAVSQ